MYDSVGGFYDQPFVTHCITRIRIPEHDIPEPVFRYQRVIAVSLFFPMYPAIRRVKDAAVVSDRPYILVMNYGKDFIKIAL